MEYWESGPGAGVLGSGTGVEYWGSGTGVESWGWVLGVEYWGRVLGWSTGIRYWGSGTGVEYWGQVLGSGPRSAQGVVSLFLMGPTSAVWPGSFGVCLDRSTDPGRREDPEPG